MSTSTPVFCPRRLCLQRWSFCNFAVLARDDVGHSWKKYFLRRSHLESKMTAGRSGGYTCKSLRGHTGETTLLFCLSCLFLCLTSVAQQTDRVVGLVYLRGASAQLPQLWNICATVCSASTDGTVRAWDIQNVRACLKMVVFKGCVKGFLHLRP